MAKKTKSKKESKTLEYLQGSKEEIKKVTWPTKNQAIRMSILVLAVVLITALVIAFLDFVLGTGNRYLLDLAPDDAIPTIEETTDSVPVNVEEPSPLSVEVLPPDAPDTPVTDQ
jgi:preprotein translocase subunit SecE